jgi:hypothetical protein
LSKSNVVIRVFGADKLDIDGVTLTILRPEKEEQRVGDIYDIVAEYKERYKATPGKVIVFSERGKEEDTYRTTITTIDNCTLLFPEPVRLRAVRILKGLKHGQKVGLDVFKRISFNEDIYIYCGEIVLADDVDAVILETEKGFRTITKKEA